MPLGSNEEYKAFTTNDITGVQRLYQVFNETIITVGLRTYFQGAVHVLIVCSIVGPVKIFLCLKASMWDLYFGAVVLISSQISSDDL